MCIHNICFKHFFKLPIELFDDIVDSLVRQHDGYFRQKYDAAGKIGLSPIQKIASAVRQLTSGVSSMEHDDKYRMAASTGCSTAGGSPAAVTTAAGSAPQHHRL